MIDERTDVTNSFQFMIYENDLLSKIIIVSKEKGIHFYSTKILILKWKKSMFFEVN